MSLLKFMLGKAAITAGRKFGEEADSPPERPEPPRPLTEFQMQDPVLVQRYEAQKAIYEEKMREYMASQGGPQEPQQTQQPSLLDFPPPQ